MALLRCPACLHVSFVETAGPHACPSCSHGAGVTTAPRLLPQTTQEIHEVYFREASAQVDAERAGRTPATATFGAPVMASASTDPAERSSRRRWFGSRAKAPSEAEAVAPTSREQPRAEARASSPTTAEPARPAKAAKPSKEPRAPGKSKKNWFARTAFSTAWGAVVLIVAGALGAIARLEAESGIDVKDRLGVDLEAALGWPTIATAVVMGILGIWWARRNPQAKGLVRSLAGIALGLALAVTFFVDVADFIDPVLAP